MCYAPDYYCACWGCETTGDTYWNPSTSWDYITVKRKNPPTQQLNSGPTPLNSNCVNNWCNPLVISFTGKGKQQQWEGRGYEWRLRLYISGKDPGLTFKLRLKVQNTPSGPVGPNKVLPNQRSPKASVPPVAAPAAPPTKAPTSPPRGHNSTSLPVASVPSTLS